MGTNLIVSEISFEREFVVCYEIPVSDWTTQLGLATLGVAEATAESELEKR